MEEVKKKIFRIILIVLGSLILGYTVDSQDRKLVNGNKLTAVKDGETYEMIVDSDESKDGYDYEIKVSNMKISKEEAESFFKKAKEEIDKTAFGDESCEALSEKLYMKESYVSGKVKADWNLSDYNIIDVDGNVEGDNLGDNGEIITASVTLTSGDYKEIYEFSINVVKEQLSEKEQFFKDLKEEVDNILANRTSNEVDLPQEIDGKKVKWREAKKWTGLKILGFICVIMILLKVREYENIKLEKEKIKKEMLIDYPDMVSKLSILVGAGMSIKQALERIAYSYIKNRDSNESPQREAYERLVYAVNMINEGESVRKAIETFGEGTGISSYHRLSRLLVQSLHKGNRDICHVLGKESEKAFEERRLNARKVGEEATTKMLMPLMLMMMIVIAIVIAPAIMTM